MKKLLLLTLMCGLPSFTADKTGPPQTYPDPKLTPGMMMEHDAAVTCVPGYTTKVRNVTYAMKAQVFRRYGLNIKKVKGQWEVDHFIPLVLGGSNDIENLWPEPQDPRPGFREKDVVEVYLHKKVCSGKMTLQQAQNAIRVDWYAVYLQRQADSTKIK